MFSHVLRDTERFFGVAESIVFDEIVTVDNPYVKSV